MKVFLTFLAAANAFSPLASSPRSLLSALAASQSDTIADIHARTILDSRGNPTVEVDLTTSAGELFRASVPSGASTGAYEATELRDGGNQWMGKGVSKAVDNVNNIIASELKGVSVTDQAKIDQMMVSFFVFCGWFWIILLHFLLVRKTNIFLSLCSLTKRNQRQQHNSLFDAD